MNSIGNMVDQLKTKMLEKLAILQRKEEEIQTLLESVDISLHEMGYYIDKQDLENMGAKPANSRMMPQSGICINEKLSFRGKDKSSEYFDVLDSDQDGLVNFEDLRGSVYY